MKRKITGSKSISTVMIDYIKMALFTKTSLYDSNFASVQDLRTRSTETKFKTTFT